MKYQEAVDGMYSLMSAIQKARSVILEPANGLNEGTREYVEMMEAEVHPWLFHPERNLLIGVMRVVDRIEAGGRLAAMEFYNFCFVAFRLEPLIGYSWTAQDRKARKFDPETTGTIIHFDDEGSDE